MDNTERKIIEAAIGCIEKHGLDKATIRLIAEEAGMNSAAISYYFRGKDKLIEIAKQTALENGFEWNDYAHTDELNAKAQLTEVLFQLSEGALRFPNITKAFFMDAFLKGDYSGSGIRKLNEFLNLLCGKLLAKCPAVSEKSMREIIYQAFCGMVLPCVLMPNAFEDVLRYDFTDSDKRKEYTINLIDKLFAGVGI